MDEMVLMGVADKVAGVLESLWAVARWGLRTLVRHPSKLDIFKIQFLHVLENFEESMKYIHVLSPR
jgi:hypothetical protein